MSTAARAVMITGGTRGIGRAIALSFAGAGADVAVSHRGVGTSSRAKAAELGRAIEALGRRPLVRAADLDDRAAMTAFLAEVESTFGRLDVLVLNAARAPFKPLTRLLERELRQLVETNFVSQLMLIRAALPSLSESRGDIIFVSSLGSRVSTPSYPLGAMKAAMETVVRDLAGELADRGVAVNAVCGGLVDTESLTALRQVWPAIESVPPELLVTPKEIAEVVLFLASPAARGIRGQTVVVDRGLSSRLRF